MRNGHAVCHAYMIGEGRVSSRSSRDGRQENNTARTKESSVESAQPQKTTEKATNARFKRTALTVRGTCLRGTGTVTRAPETEEA